MFIFFSRARRRTSSGHASANRIVLFLLTLTFVALPVVCLCSPQKPLATPGLTREFSASISDVRQAVTATQADRIIHGTLVFDKEPILTGAEATDSTSLFEPWTGPGEVFYKIRKAAVAPRHFVASGDQGTIGVRYVVIPVDANRTRVRIDAVYLETAHHEAHASDGTVEKSEMKEVKDALDSLLQAQMDAADARRREQSAELVRQSYTRQREDESTRLEKANNEIKDLEQEIISVRHEIQRRVKAPGTDLKAAPFQSAASLKTLAAYTDVVILIVTPHWLGVETPQGQRGWLPVSQLEQLP
jgi:hypothetical protein